MCTIVTLYVDLFLVPCLSTLFQTMLPRMHPLILSLWTHYGPIPGPRDGTLPILRHLCGNTSVDHSVHDIDEDQSVTLHLLTHTCCVHSDVEKVNTMIPTAIHRDPYISILYPFGHLPRYPIWGYPRTYLCSKEAKCRQSIRRDLLR